MAKISGIAADVQKSVLDAAQFSGLAGNVDVIDGPAFVNANLHLADYAVGVISGAAAAVEALGRARGLPAQKITVDRRLANIHFTALTFDFLNGQNLFFDCWGDGADNGLYPTKDGRHISTIGTTHVLRNKFLNFLGVPLDAQAIERAILKFDALDIEQKFADVGVPGGVVRSLDEWSNSDVGQHTAKLPLFTMKSEGSSHTRDLGKARSRPFEGVRVLELSNIIANPTAAMLFGQLGADVVNILPVTGDFVYPGWFHTGWGKRSIRLNIRSDGGRKQFAKLISEADVLHTGHAPGALERLGFGQDELMKLNPNLIVAGISVQSRGTPWEGRKGFEQIGQAISGVVAALSANDPAHPVYAPVLINDYGTAYLLVAGVAAALCHRIEKGGFWLVGPSLVRNGMEAAKYTGCTEKGQIATGDDLKKYMYDVETFHGTWTRLQAAFQFETYRSASTVAPPLPGSTHPIKMEWRTADWYAQEDARLKKVDFGPSAVVASGGIIGWNPNGGFQDRSDHRGGNDFSSLFKG